MPSKRFLFSNLEFTDMVVIYGEANGNACKARRIYASRFPNRHLPHRSTFISTVQRLRETGTFQPRKGDVGRLQSVRSLSSGEEEEDKEEQEEDDKEEQEDEEEENDRKEHRTYLDIPNIKQFYEVLKK